MNRILSFAFVALLAAVGAAQEKPVGITVDRDKKAVIIDAKIAPRKLADPASNKPMPKVKWRFTGSKMTKPDPAKDETVYGADLTGTLIAIFPVTDQTVVQTSLSMKEEKYLKLETNTKLLPKEGTAIK